MYQLFRPKFRIDETLSEIKTCLEKGWTGIGYKTVKIEEKWKDLFNFNNAHFTTSNTAGLFLAFQVLKEYYGWNDDDEVISTPLTFVATNHSVFGSNLCPVFADIDESLNLDPKSVISKISDKTRAIIFVGIGGNTHNYKVIREIAKDRSLLLILDAAHMAGSFLDGKHVGVDADCTVFSFQAVKNLPTADSGMVCFKESALDKLARERSWLGITKDTFSRTNSSGKYKWDYDVTSVSNKYHGNSIMAAMALVSVKYLMQDNLIRAALSQKYSSIFSSHKSIKFIEHEELEKSTFSSRHLAQIILPASVDRNEFILKLNSFGIFPGVHYKSNSFYSPYKHMSSDVPNAESLSNQILSLPLHLELLDSDVEFIANTIMDVFDNK